MKLEKINWFTLHAGDMIINEASERLSPASYFGCPEFSCMLVHRKNNKSDKNPTYTLEKDRRCLILKKYWMVESISTDVLLHENSYLMFRYPIRHVDMLCEGEILSTTLRELKRWCRKICVE